MVREEIKKAILFKLKSISEQKSHKKEVLEAFDAKAEDVITTFEKSIYTDLFKKELESFKDKLLKKSLFEKFIEKTAFLVPLLFSLFFIKIIYTLDEKCKKIDILHNYLFELSAIGILLIIWFIGSLIFVFKK